MRTLPPPTFEELMVQTRPQDRCYIWTGTARGASHSRYGVIYRSKYFLQHSKGALAVHRYVLHLFEPDFDINDPTQVVRHTCNNPLCINPAHLMLGTQQDNVRDRDVANRTQQGETHCRAKLKESDVCEIFSLLHAGWPNIAIATAYDVNDRTISGIKTGKTWKPLTKALMSLKHKEK